MDSSRMINVVLLVFVLIVSVVFGSSAFGFSKILVITLIAMLICGLFNGVYEQYDREVRGDVVNAIMRGSIVGGIALVVMSVIILLTDFFGGVFNA